MSETLALCMMVRDEAATLERALKSAAFYVDEICILDTGSTDATPEIAQRYADVFATERFEPFHFAKARNASVALASCRYVLILDADEYLAGHLVEWLGMRERLRSEKPGSVTVTLDNVLAGGAVHDRERTRRIFLREEVEWEGRIHHSLVRDPGRQMETRAEIHHTGYDLTQEAKREKFATRVEMNRRAALENKHRPKTYAYYRRKYAEALAMTGQYDVAAEVYRWCYKNEHLAHARMEIATNWVKALIDARRHQGKMLVREVAVSLASEVAQNAALRGEPVPLYWAACLLSLEGEPVTGLHLFDICHQMMQRSRAGGGGGSAAGGFQPFPRLTLSERVLRETAAALLESAQYADEGARLRACTAEETPAVFADIHRIVAAGEPEAA